MKWRMALVFFLLAGCGPGSGDLNRTVEVPVGDQSRTFELFVPAGVATPAPLVVVFHGFTSNAEEIRRTSGFDAVARERGFVVAYPQALGLLPAWRADPAQEDDDLEFFEAVVAAVGELVPIDARSVAVAGFSNGGGMAVRVGCERPGMVAAVGVVSGAIGEDFCLPPSGVPLLAFHGTGDVVVPYRGVTGYLAGAETWVAAWASAAGCRLEPAAPVAPDVFQRVTTGCATPVALYTVVGGGHGWPGTDRRQPWGSTSATLPASKMIAELLESVTAS